MSIAPAVRRPSSLRRWTRRLLMLAAVGAVAIGSFVGWQLYRRHLDDLRLRETIAGLDARDPRWRLEDIEADRAIVPEAENSATVIRAIAARLTRRVVTPGEEFVDLHNLNPATVLTDEQFREVIDWIESSESAIGPSLLLEQFPRGRHPITLTADGIGTLLRHADDMTRVYNQVLWPLLVLHIHEADATAAVRDCVCLVNLGRSIGDEPFAVSQFIRQRYVEAAARGVERLLGQLVVTDADLARLQAIFAEEAAQDAWPLMLRGERAMIHRAMTALGSGAIKTSAIRRGLISNPPARSVIGQVLEWIEDRSPPHLSDAHRWLLDQMTRMLEQSAPLPWHERAVVVAALCAEKENAPELAQVWGDMSRALARCRQYHALIRCTIAAIAAERYRLRHDAWPPSAAELVPAFLPEWPLDPFDGKPLRYKRLADGVVIYSVGADGIDDGGRISPTLTQQPMTDIGARLWDVNQRRRPPQQAAADTPRD